MGTNGDKRSAFGRRHRRKLVALGVLFAVAAIGWLILDRYLLDMERYRQLAIETIGRRTGVEAEFGRIDLDLGFSPKVTIQNAVLRDPDATASVSQASASFDLSGLFQRRLRIVVLVDGLDVHAPSTPSDVQGVVDRIMARWEETRTDDASAFDVALDRIQAKDVRVFFDARDEAFAVLNAQVDDALSDRISIAVDGHVPGAGENAQLDGNVKLTLSPANELSSISGVVALEAAALDRLPLKNAPSGAVQARLTLEPVEAAHGATLHLSLDAPNRPALTGELDANATWADDALHLRRVSWNSEGARIEGSGSYASADHWSASVQQARFSEEFLDALLAMAERPRVRFEAEKGALIELEGIEAAPADEGPVRLTAGEATFAGLAVVPTLEGTETRAARGIHGSLRVADNVIQIEKIETKSARISGSLTPDFAANTARVDIQGEANLAQLPWDVFDVAELHRLEGEVSLTRFAGTISKEGLADGFELDGELQNGAVVYADEYVNVDIRSATGQFASDGQSVETSLTATIEDDVPLRVSGAYAMQENRWRGTLELDASEAAPAIFEDDVDRWVVPIAASVGAAIADIDIAFPTADRTGTTISVERRGEGELNAQIGFAEDARLATITAQGTLPVDVLLSGYFASITGTGHAGIAIRYDAPAKQIALTVDATNASIETESIFRKSAGAGLVVDIDAAVDPGLALNSLEIRVDGVPAITTTAAPQNGVIPLEIDMPLLVPLLVDGASAGGTILVRYDSKATAAELAFDSVSVKAGDQLALDRIHGPLYIYPQGVSSDGLQIHGARSDCTLRLAKVGDQWTGGLEGTKLNVNAVNELIEAAQAFMPSNEDALDAADAAPPADEGVPALPESYWRDPIHGEFAVSLDKLYFHRGTLSDVRFRILADDQAIRFRDVSVQPETGQLTASIAIIPDPVDDVVLKLSVNVTDLDARTINDLLWSDSKEFFGTIATGSVEFSGPLADLETMLAGGDGSVKWHGTKGSLGQIGFATKILTALKTTDILNLRLRSLRDKGITYDTWDVDMRMTDGVARVHEFFLDGGSYTMQSEGTINFAAQKTDVLVYVRPLESVGNVIRRVPLIGGLAAAVSTDLLGVPVKFSGSPYDPEVSVAKELLKDLATTPIRAGQGAVKSVTGGSDNSGAQGTPPENAESRPPSAAEAPQGATNLPDDSNDVSETIAAAEPTAP